MSQAPREKATAVLEDAFASLVPPQTEEDVLQVLEAGGLAVVDARALQAFLGNCGEASACSGCGVPIWWFTSRRNTRWPITAAGANHFGDCPKADEFRRDR